MNNTTVYVGMDVHKESFTLCAYTLEKEKGSYSRRTPADYKEVLKYLEFLRTVYGNDTIFVCGYEAGCRGYTLIKGSKSLQQKMNTKKLSGSSAVSSV